MSSIDSRNVALKIWLWSLTIFILINAILYVILAAYIPTSKFTDEANLETLREVERIKAMYPNDKIVVVIGSSKVLYGFYCPSYYRESFEADGVKPIHVFKIHRGGFGWQHFTNELNLIKKLTSSKPDLLLIESDLILFQFGTKSSKWQDLYDQYLDRIRNAKNSLISQRPLDQLCDNPYIYNLEDSSKVKATKRRLHNVDHLHLFIESMSLLQEQNIEIGLLELPFPIQKQLLIEELIDQKQWRNLLSTLQEHEIGYLKMDKEMFWSEFRDSGHMNKKGRKQFNTWFLSYLQSKWD